MTRRQRHLAYEGIAIFVVATLGGGHALPQMMSARDSMTVIASGFLTIMLVAWLVWFAARAFREFGE
jgi:hypothetical protein